MQGKLREPRLRAVPNFGERDKQATKIRKHARVSEDIFESLKVKPIPRVLYYDPTITFHDRPLINIKESNINFFLTEQEVQ